MLGVFIDLLCFYRFIVTVFVVPFITVQNSCSVQVPSVRSNWNAGAVAELSQSGGGNRPHMRTCRC